MKKYSFIPRCSFSLLLAAILMISCGLSACSLTLPEFLNPENLGFPDLGKHSTDPVREAPSSDAATLTDVFALDASELSSLDKTGSVAYGDETVTRYKQSFGGLEIYNSSICVISGEEQAAFGCYYDLSDAFGEELDALAQEAAREPDWLAEALAATTEVECTLCKPVIFITEDHTAVVARQINLAWNGLEAELVVSLDGQTVYALDSGCISYAPATLTSGDLSAIGAEKDGRYYAYNTGDNFFVLAQSSEDAANKLGNQKNFRAEEQKIYSLKSADWSGKTDRAVFETYLAFKTVYDWFAITFDQHGLDNNGTALAIVVNDNGKGNYKNIGDKGLVFYLETNKKGDTLLAAPEILVHEYTHGILRNQISLNTEYESGALHEAIADTFAAVYLRNEAWVIGEGVDSRKDLANGTAGSKDSARQAPTHMDDYIEDRWEPDEGLIYDIQEFLMGLALGDPASKHTHQNSHIISHTLYLIWRDVFDGDWDGFGRVLYRTIRYLPSNAGFSAFRDAFVYATVREGFPQQQASLAAGRFTAAGITTANRVPVLKRKDPDLPTAMELSCLPGYRLLEMDWDSVYIDPPVGYYDPWQITLKKDATEFVIHVFSSTGDAMTDPYSFTDPPVMLRVNSTDPKGYPVTDLISIGMTLERVEYFYELVETSYDPTGADRSFTAQVFDGIWVNLQFHDGVLVQAEFAATG